MRSSSCWDGVALGAEQLLRREASRVPNWGGTGVWGGAEMIKTSYGHPEELSVKWERREGKGLRAIQKVTVKVNQLLCQSHEPGILKYVKSRVMETL